MIGPAESRRNVMKDQHLEDDVVLDVPVEHPEHSPKLCASTKFERRRRIEELSEERRLRDELSEY